MSIQVKWEDAILKTENAALFQHKKDWLVLVKRNGLTEGIWWDTKRSALRFYESVK
jgi:hypothetical protein